MHPVTLSALNILVQQSRNRPGCIHAHRFMMYVGRACHSNMVEDVQTRLSLCLRESQATRQGGRGTPLKEVVKLWHTIPPLGAEGSHSKVTFQGTSKEDVNYALHDRSRSVRCFSVPPLPNFITFKFMHYTASFSRQSSVSCTMGHLDLFLDGNGDGMCKARQQTQRMSHPIQY